MKKSIICMGIILGCLNVRASVVTNWVYVVSNIFHNVYHESIVTQKVKSSHTDYYFTNYVSVVTNVYQSTFNTNMDITVVFDNFDPWVSAASNSAASAALSAGSASGYADSARIYSSQASTYANNAYSYQVGTINAANSGLAQINDRIDWFIEHSGETITMNITNTYFAEDNVARAGVTNNAIAISALCEDVSELDDRITTLESDAYVQDPEWGGVYSFVFFNASWRFRATIDTNNHGQQKRESGIDYIVYYNSVSGSTDPCSVVTISGTRPPYLIIRKVLSGSNAGKLQVYWSTNGNTWYTWSTSDAETSPRKLPTGFSSSRGYLESYTGVKRKVSDWVLELMAGVTNRITVLEGFHGISQ